jgi:hypothetical protein
MTALLRFKKDKRQRTIIIAIEIRHGNGRGQRQRQKNREGLMLGLVKLPNGFHYLARLLT